MARRIRTAADTWDQVARHADDECWLWTGALTTSGYGQVWFDGRKHTAHRVTYELTLGPIPVGLALDHLCRNRACVNPSHLEPVTTLENSRRAPEWKGNLTYCPQGHPYAGDNLYVRPSDRARLCRICKDAHSLRAKRQRRAQLVMQGFTTRGTPRKRPQAASDSGPGCPGSVAALTHNE